MRRVLFVAYLYPPVGGAGVQRSAKFVKYLPSYGWLPSVLTVANPSVPLIDTSLAIDTPQEVILRRARTLEPSYAVKSVVSAGANGNGHSGSVRRLARRTAHTAVKLLLQPDPQVLWLPDAIREGRRLLRDIPHDAILVSAPPFSSFFVGVALSRWSGLPLVLDYRDEWDLSNAYLENRRPDAFSRFVQRRLQTRAVRAAKAVLATTLASADALASVCKAANSRARVQNIYNGYDPDDFPAPSPAPAQRDFFRLAYVGSLWNLTSVRPLVDGVRKLAAHRPDLAKRLELVFAGRRTNEQQHILAELDNLPARLVAHPYVDHVRITEIFREADALCLLLAGAAGAERVVPAKTFEYMAARRHIVAIAPRGELWDILRDYPAKHLLEPTDQAGIALALQELIETRPPGPPRVVLYAAGDQYARPRQAQQLAALLDCLVD
jgi:glycosyltransferase involved in cell wall biosynthesis